MSRNGGRWLLVEAGILVVAAVAAAAAHLSPALIAIVMGGAFALVGLLDLAVTRTRAGGPRLEPAQPSRHEPRRGQVDGVRVDGGRRPQAPPAWAPPARAKPAAQPSARPPQRPAPEPALSPAGNGTKWNVWDLQRRARSVAGQDPLRDEEMAFLLLYLREFAGSDGVLPADFDRLVRTSFGELVSVR